MNALSAFPVKRNSKRRWSNADSLATTEVRRVVGIFPEGGIRAGAYFRAGRSAMWPGFIAVSPTFGKPVVPCVILGLIGCIRPAIGGRFDEFGLDDFGRTDLAAN